MIVRSVDQVGRFAVVISSSPLRTDTLVVSWTVAGGQLGVGLHVYISHDQRTLPDTL